MVRLQECEQCPAVALVREVETIRVTVEAGMKDGQVSGWAGSHVEDTASGHMDSVMSPKGRHT